MKGNRSNADTASDGPSGGFTITGTTNNGNAFLHDIVIDRAEVVTGTVTPDRVEGEDGAFDFGADTLTGGAGSDVFVVASNGAAQDTADVITDFNDGEDLIDFAVFGLAAAAGDYAEGPIGGHGNFNGALAQANNDFVNLNIIYSAQQVGGDVYIFADLDDGFGFAGQDGVADQVVQLTGVTLADLDNSGNFIV